MGSVGFGVGLFGRWCLRLALALPATVFGFRSPFDGMNDFDRILKNEQLIVRPVAPARGSNT